MSDRTYHFARHPDGEIHDVYYLNDRGERVHLADEYVKVARAAEAQERREVCSRLLLVLLNTNDWLAKAALRLAKEEIERGEHWNRTSSGSEEEEEL